MTLQNQTNAMQDNIVNIKFRNGESQRSKNSLNSTKKQTNMQAKVHIEQTEKVEVEMC